jgi:hypothetical protein
MTGDQVTTEVRTALAQLTARVAAGPRRVVAS